MTHSINFKGYLLKIKRIKTHSITARIDNFSGECFLTVPKNLPLSEINSYLERNFNRIEKIIKSCASYGKSNDMNSGDIVSFWGKDVSLVIKNAKGFSYKLDNDSLIIQGSKIDTPLQRAELIKHCYKIETEIKARFYLEKWSKLTGLKPSSLTISWVKTRWGSCKFKTKSIRVNGRHAFFPEEFLSLTILHELIHLKVSNHGSEFYNLLFSYYPDYKIVSKTVEKGIKAGQYKCF